MGKGLVLIRKWGEKYVTPYSGTTERVFAETQSVLKYHRSYGIAAYATCIVPHKLLKFRVIFVVKIPVVNETW